MIYGPANIAESARPKRTTTGRKCSVCTHSGVATINKAIYDGKSFRGISLNYGMSNMSVSRHAENCLKLDLQALLKEGKVSKAIDVYEEFCEQLAFVKKARAAAEKWMVDPTDDEAFSVDPRATEVAVVYYDSLVTDAQGNPTRQKASLQELLDRIGGGRYQVRDHTIRTIDLREYALKTIDKCDLTIAQFAKLSGAYTKDKGNPATVREIAEEVTAKLVARGWTEEKARAFTAQNYPDISDAVH